LHAFDCLNKVRIEANLISRINFVPASPGGRELDSNSASHNLTAGRPVSVIIHAQSVPKHETELEKGQRVPRYSHFNVVAAQRRPHGERELDSNLATLNRAAGIVRHDLVFTDGVWV
jgi:hypothetical protein